jgi:hypothetical protein
VIRWREGRVVAVVREWDGTLELEVRLAPVVRADPAVGAGAAGPRTTCRALAYPALVGRPLAGDVVLLNTNALERGLGTGGYAMVVAVPNRLPDDQLIDRPVGQPAGEPAGHLVKGRYGPLQAMVLGVDEQESAHHAVLRDADDLLGLPVVVADLHSALPAVLAGLRERRPDARVAYLMTDGGALPAWFSRTVAGLRAAGWLAACISAGQAFGGDLEAVTLHTALLAARHVVGADVAVVVQGPGNLGTGTRWGFSGVQAGEAVNAAAVLRGRPVAALRVSGADPRPRHLGVSHHSLTAYGRVALATADVVVPLLGGELGATVRAQAAPLGRPDGRHRLVEVDVTGLAAALAACPVPLSTMGRGPDADPAAFLASAAAGRHAAELIDLSGRRPDRPRRSASPPA